MKVLAAPNAFKHCLDALEAAKAIANGFAQSRLQCQCTLFPIADGGDGTAAMLLYHLRGEDVPVQTVDALGNAIASSFGWLPERKTAIMEMSAASGIRWLKENELQPFYANTFGTGLLIKAALDKGAQHIIMGVGGSATTDGGTGIIRALGGKLLDEQGNDIGPLPYGLTRLHSIDLSGLDQRLLHCSITVLCDVDTTLLGEHNAVQIFAPQKGAGPQEIVYLEQGMQQYAAVVERQLGINIASLPYGGAAGGTAAGLMAMLQAKLVNGIDYFLDLTGFDQALQQADIVITGEGSLDEQTLSGKAPVGVAKAAKRYGKLVVALAGKVPLELSAEWYRYFDAVFPINHELSTPAEALQKAAANLSRTACQVANLLGGKA